MKEKQTDQLATIPTIENSNLPSDIEVRTKGRYIFSGKYWGRGQARIEYRLWKFFWIFLTISGIAGISLGAGISIYLDLTAKYGWWLPIVLSLMFGLLFAWLIIPLFYNVAVPLLSAGSEVWDSEQS